MDTNNYLGSFAQENVTFQTIVEETSSYGQNMTRTMFFTDNSQIADPTALLPVAGSSTIKAAIVTAETFASVAKGILQSWMVDLYASGNLYDSYIVSVGDSLDADKVEEAYNLLKAYAYWKVPVTGKAAGTDPDADPADPNALDATVFTACAARLADLCLIDKQVLSGAVPAPLFTANAAQFATDPIYTGLKGKYVFMSYHQDSTRNAALFSIGLALGTINGSGTPCGNQFHMWKTNNITSNDLSQTVRATLNAAYIQTWKSVGDNSANVAAECQQALNGDYPTAMWIVAYVTYMSKVRIAVYMTSPGVYKGPASYQNIVAILSDTLSPFAGVLQGIAITAPSYGDLPESDSTTLIIPNAWTATYRDVLRHVTISGTLTIEG